MNLLIENLQKEIDVLDEDIKLMESVISKCLEYEGFDKSVEISLLLVNDNIIREMNSEYRGIDKSTDVLSFPMLDINDGVLGSLEGDINPDGGDLLLGDIVLSLETATLQATEYGHSLKREIAFLISHGMFHLLGYDHMDEAQEKQMFTKQEEVLSILGIERK